MPAVVANIVAPSFRSYFIFSAVVYVLYVAASYYYEEFSTPAEFLFYQYEQFWTDIFLLNALTCVFVLVARVFIQLVFGQLRAIEEQNLKDKLNSFLLYKFVFLFGVLNLGEVGSITRWVTWCGSLALILVLNKLCRDRAHYLSLSPSSRLTSYIPIFLINLSMYLTTFVLFVGIIRYKDESFSISLFLLADVLIHHIQSLYSFIKLGLLVYDHITERWENKDITFYYTEMILKVLLLYIEIFHNVHMLIYGGVSLTMGSFVLCMHIKYLYQELVKRWQRHKNFRSILDNLDSRFQPATSEELEANNDHCAICWDDMESARKLPCGHMFHIQCLRSWLEHDTSCPTCRMTFNDQQQGTQQTNTPQDNDAAANQPRNMAWQFRGFRWASWLGLPSFSVHVIRSPQHIAVDMNLRMVNQVHEVLPHIPRHVIENDLQRTLDAELTIANLLINMNNEVQNNNNTPEQPFGAQQRDDDEEAMQPTFTNMNTTPASSQPENLTEQELRRRRVLEAVDRRWNQD